MSYEYYESRHSHKVTISASNTPIFDSSTAVYPTGKCAEGKEKDIKVFRFLPNKYKKI
jgi:hypothetical protein